jgi:hypothetical protein
MADQLTPTDDPFLSLLRPQEQHMNSSRLGDPNVDMKTALEEWQAGRNTGDLQDVLSVHELCHRGQSPADMEDRDITYVEWDSIQNVIDGNTQHVSIACHIFWPRRIHLILGRANSISHHRTDTPGCTRSSKRKAATCAAFLIRPHFLIAEPSVATSSWKL